MKISQLVETKIPYYESLANRLPRDIKSQQELLNFGYRVAVEDLGLAKASSLNENFAAKLINSYHKQCLEEGVGTFLGRTAGHAVGAAGSAGRKLASAWKDAKQGYADAKASWDTKTDASTPPSPGSSSTTSSSGATGGAGTPGATGNTGATSVQGATGGAGGSEDPRALRAQAAKLTQRANELTQRANEIEKQQSTAAAPQGQALDLDRLKKDREAKLAAAQAGQQQAQQQMAATAQSNAATNQQDAAIKAAADAAKAKPAFQQSASDKLAIKQAADKGIREAEEPAEIFHSKFLGIQI